MATHKDPVALDVMRAVKAAIDPHGPDEPRQGAAHDRPVRPLCVYLTHAAEARANYYGDEALAKLREVAAGAVERHRAATSPAASWRRPHAGCDAIVSYRLSHGPAALFENAPDLVAFIRCAVDIRDVDVAAARARRASW